jgi:DNA-binding NtrC family response regulator
VGSAPRCEAGVLERLASHAWPGNVRELQNVLARLRLEHPRSIPLRAVAAALASERPAGLFPPEILGRGTLAELTRQLERDYLLHQLERHAGDTRAVSRLLGVTRKHLYRRCQKLGIRLR